MSGIHNFNSKLTNKVSSVMQNLRTAGPLSQRNQKMQQPSLQDKKKKPLLINDNLENIGSIQRKVISKPPIVSNKNKAVTKMKNLQTQRIPLNDMPPNPNQEKDISSPITIPPIQEEELPIRFPETPITNTQIKKSPPSGSNELLAKMEKMINSMKAKHKPKQIDFLETPKQTENVLIPNELFSNEIASDLKTQISMEKEGEEDNENSKVIVIFEDTGAPPAAGSDEILAAQQIKGINDIELLSSSSVNSSVQKLGKKLKKKHLSMLRFLSSKSHNKSLLSSNESVPKEEPIIVTAFDLNSPPKLSPSPQPETKTITSSLANIQDLRSTIQMGIQNMEENFTQARKNFFTAINSYMEEKNRKENPKVSLKRVFPKQNFFKENSKQASLKNH